MKFIDDKGRIFGIVNVVDFIAILMLVGVISMAYIGYKVLAAQNVAKSDVWVNVRIRSSDIISELADVVTEGDVNRDAFGKIVGRVKKIESRKPAEAFIAARDQSLITFNRSLKKDLVIDLELLCELKGKKGKVFLYNGNPIKIGASVTFFTDNYDISGLIIAINK